MRRRPAFQNKDIEALASVDTPDYKSISTTGEVTDQEETIAILEKGFDRIEPGAVYHAYIQSISFRPDGAVVTVRESMVLTARGPDGRSHKFRLNDSSRDFWVHTDAGWKIKQSRELTYGQMSVDSRPVRLRRRSRR